MLKLAIFDFDSTLIEQETLDEIARASNKQEQISQITDLAMNGKLDFYESLTKRVAMLEGLSYSFVQKACANLSLTKGAKELIKELKKMQTKVLIFSGGFAEATNVLGKELGVDADFSNFFHVKNNKLTGKLGGDMMFSNSKGVMTAKIQAVLGVLPKDTLVCGDGANDLSMFEFADKKVAFCAKDVLKTQANIVIDKRDLQEILNYI